MRRLEALYDWFVFLTILDDLVSPIAGPKIIDFLPKFFGDGPKLRTVHRRLLARLGKLIPRRIWKSCGRIQSGHSDFDDWNPKLCQGWDVRLTCGSGFTGNGQNRNSFICDGRQAGNCRINMTS